MDKMRALQCFVAAAQEGSLAGAARRLEVSVPSIHKMVGALERDLGVPLFDRSARGLRLTASGQAYLEGCEPLMQELAALDERVGRAERRPAGVLVVGAHPQLAQHLVVPALPQFHAACPEVLVDLRTVNRLGDADADPVDVFLLHGWPDAQDLVHQKLGYARTVIAASPAYWASHGMLQHPRELAQRTCVMMRNPAGILLDLWEFQRADESFELQVGGWFSSNSRDATLATVLAGHGIGRFSELASLEWLGNGQLVPGLPDWEVRGGPPLNLLYRPGQRRTARVRHFIDFITEWIARRMAGSRGAVPQPLPELPRWHRRGSSRASAILRWPG